jgi:hypothetical protein
VVFIIIDEDTVPLSSIIVLLDGGADALFLLISLQLMLQGQPI